MLAGRPSGAHELDTHAAQPDPRFTIIACLQYAASA